jgi:hypothetical protein
VSRSGELRKNGLAILLFFGALVGAAVLGVSLLNEATGELSDDEVADACDERVANRLGADDPSFADEVSRCTELLGSREHGVPGD